MWWLRKRQHGISLLETLLYVGAFVVILPATVNIFLQMLQSQELYRSRVQMEQAAGIVFTHMATELVDAPSVLISTSTLGVDGSVLRYTNDSAQEVVIDRPSTTVDFSGTTHNINRLRLTVGNNPAVWMTPETVNVTKFRLDAVSNSLAQTTGLNLDLEMAEINPTEGPYRAASFDSQTTIAFPASVMIL